MCACVCKFFPSKFTDSLNAASGSFKGLLLHGTQVKKPSTPEKRRFYPPPAYVHLGSEVRQRPDPSSLHLAPEPGPVSTPVAQFPMHRGAQWGWFLDTKQPSLTPLPPQALCLGCSPWRGMSTREDKPVFAPKAPPFSLVVHFYLLYLQHPMKMRG